MLAGWHRRITEQLSALCLAPLLVIALLLLIFSPGADAATSAPICAPPDCVFPAKPTKVQFKASGKSAKRSKLATLSIKTISLPKGARANLSIANGKKSKRRLRARAGATVRLNRMRAGTWTVSAEPVVARGMVYYPEIRVYKAAIRAGARAKITFDYSSAYSKSVRYAKGSAILALFGPTAGAYKLTVKDPGRLIKKGSVFAVGVGKFSPAGLLLRIQSVKSSRGRTTLTAVDGELSDLGKISFDFQKNIPASVVSRRLQSRLLKFDTVDPDALGSSFSCGRRLGTQAPGSELVGRLKTIGPDFKLAASVEHFVEPVFTMSVTGGIAMEFDLDIRGGYGCTLDLRSGSIGLGIYPIPGTAIIVNPFIQIQVTGSADVGEQFSFHVNERITATAGAKITPFGVHPFGDADRTSASTLTAASGGISAKVAAGPVVTFYANGLKTASLGLNGYVKGTLGYPTSVSPLRVVAGLEATGSLSMAGLFTLTSGILLHKEWELIGGGDPDPEQALKSGGPHDYSNRVAEGSDPGDGFVFSSFDTVATRPLIYTSCAGNYCIFTTGSYPGGENSPYVFDSQTFVRGADFLAGPFSAGEGGVGAVECVSPGLCYGVTPNGVFKRFEGSGWVEALPPGHGFGSESISNLTCAPGICAGSGLGGDVNIYIGPPGDPTLHPGVSIYDMSCVSAAWCLLTGRKNISGDLITGQWTLENGVMSVFHPGQNIGEDFLNEPIPGRFSCATPSLCFGIIGGYLTKWDGEKWSEPGGIGNGYTLYDVTCRNDGTIFCAASNSDGYVYTFSGGDWIQSTKLPVEDDALLKLSCGSPTYCAGIEGVPSAP